MEPIVNPSPMPERFPGGLPYYSINAYYQRLFGQRTRKISVQISQTCPVRAVGAELCVFCDETGAGGMQIRYGESLEEQIRQNALRLTAKTKAEAFLVYFQPYTSTFTGLQHLEKSLRSALAQPGVKGLVLATRPDCLPPNLFPLLRELAQTTYFSVELGVQSFEEPRVAWLKRGHSAAQSIQAVQDLQTLAQVQVGVHLIFGLPGMQPSEAAAAADWCNQLQVENVKLHHLHVLKGAPLEAEFAAGRYHPPELAEYADQVVAFLSRLNPGIAVQRLAGTVDDPATLVAPAWTLDRVATRRFILERLTSQGKWQGCEGSPLQP